MQIKTKREGETLAVLLTGELDHHSAAPLRVELDAMLQDEGIRCLILDLCGVSFMDSSGLGVVLGRYKALKARRGSLRIRGASKPVERILKMAGVYALLGQQDEVERGTSHV
ncbi:MAG: STAS domain-containing protein [Clostridiales bacterium]|nr:STAS domain-containing protein [Clostridiales bacterium]